MNNIRIFDYKLSFLQKIFFLRYALDILGRGFLTNDVYNDRFASGLTKLISNKTFAHSPHLLTTCSSGTSALILLLRSLPSEITHVLVPNNTFIATWQAIKSANLVPVVVDTSELGIGISHVSMVEALSRYPNCAVLDVHIGGFLSTEWEKNRGTCKVFNSPYIEDAAQSLGAMSKSGLQAGMLGDGAAFSFHLTKVLTCGEGGAVVLPNSAHRAHAKIKALRQFGISLENPNLFLHESENHKLSELSAALGLVSLMQLSKRVERRRAIRDLYDHYLDKGKYLVYSDKLLGSRSSCYKTIVRPSMLPPSKIRSRIANIFPFTGYVYKENLSSQPVVMRDDATIFWDSLVNSNDFSSSHFCPPTYPELTNKQVFRVIEALNSL